MAAIAGRDSRHAKNIDRIAKNLTLWVQKSKVLYVNNNLDGLVTEDSLPLSKAAIVGSLEMLPKNALFDHFVFFFTEDIHLL
jgi:hypothetical protein